MADREGKEYAHHFPYDFFATILTCWDPVKAPGSYCCNSYNQEYKIKRIVAPQENELGNFIYQAIWRAYDTMDYICLREENLANASRPHTKNISLGMRFDFFDLLLTSGACGTPGAYPALCKCPPV